MSFLKVIYALNTKNDEHELILASVKEQHEGQIQSILAETRNKVEYYRYFEAYFFGFILV